MKDYDCYKIYPNCTCNFFNFNKICDQCDSTCEYKLAAWECRKISSDIVGPFEFDSDTEKTTFVNKLGMTLTNGQGYCIKAQDSKYIDEYSNNKYIIKQKLSYNTFTLNDLLNIISQDQYVIKQRNKSPIKIVSKFNIFTGQDSLDDLFSFRKKVYSNIVLEHQEKRYALH
ncbi:10594_t:CDS:2, partial [Cetraspora pellucida]